MTVTISCGGERGSRPPPPAVIMTSESHTIGVRRGSAHQIDRLGARGTCPEESRGAARTVGRTCLDVRLQGKHFSRIPCSKHLQIDTR